MLILGFLYGALLWTGYDRLPLLPVVGDGPLIQDPALSLARGLGLRAPSFGETLDLAQVYAHHPPVYIYLQSFILLGLGLTPFSLRFASLVFALLAFIAWLACFGLLQRRGWLDWGGFWLCALLYLAEPTIFSLGRWERMDSLVNFLVAASILVLLLAAGPVKTGQTTRQAHPAWLLPLLSAFLLGLALSTHLAAVSAWLVWICLLIAWRQGRPRKTLIGLALFPWLVFGVLWVATYQSASLAALHQLYTISSHHAGGMLAYFEAISSSMRNPRTLVQAAPLLNLAVLAGWLLAAWALVKTRSQSPPVPPANGRFWLCGLWAGLSLSIPFILFVAGFNPRHTAILFPFALVAAGMALHQAELGRKPGVMVKVAVIAFLAAALAVQALTFTTLFTEWNERRPDRFLKLSAEIPQEARVAAVPDFWYFFQSRGQVLRLVDYGFPEDRLYWETHAASELPAFDYVILYPGHPLSSLAASLSRQQQPLAFGSSDYVLYTIK